MENPNSEKPTDHFSEKPSRLNSIVRNIILGLEGTAKGRNNGRKPTEKEILGKLKDYLSSEKDSQSDESGPKDWIVKKPKDEGPKPSKTLIHYFGSPSKTKNQKKDEDVEDFLEDIKIEANWRPITVKECWTPGNSKPKNHHDHGGPLSGITRSMVSKATSLGFANGKSPDSEIKANEHSSEVDSPRKKVDDMLPRSAKSKASDTLSIISSHSSNSISSSTLSYLDRHGYLRAKFTHFGKCTTFLTGLIFGILLILVPVIIVDTNERITGREKILCSCPVASGYQQPNYYGDNSLDEVNQLDGTTIQPMISTKPFKTFVTQFTKSVPLQNKVNNDISDRLDSLEEMDAGNTTPLNSKTHSTTVSSLNELVDELQSTETFQPSTISNSNANLRPIYGEQPSPSTYSTTFGAKIPELTRVTTPVNSAVTHPPTPGSEEFFATNSPKNGYTETHFGGTIQQQADTSTKMEAVITTSTKTSYKGTSDQQAEFSTDIGVSTTGGYTETLDYPKQGSGITSQNQVKETILATQSTLSPYTPTSKNLTQSELYTVSPDSLKNSTIESNNVPAANDVTSGSFPKAFVTVSPTSETTIPTMSTTMKAASNSTRKLQTFDATTKTARQVTVSPQSSTVMADTNKVASSSTSTTQSLYTTTKTTSQAADLMEPTLTDQELDYLENLIEELRPERNGKGKTRNGRSFENPTSLTSVNPTTSLTTKKPTNKKPSSRKDSDEGETVSNGDRPSNISRPNRRRPWWQRFINAVENAFNKMNPFKRKNGVVHIVIE